MATVLLLCGFFLILDHFFNQSDDAVSFANHQKLLDEVAKIDAQITETELSNKIIHKLNEHGYTLVGSIGYTVYPDKQIIALFINDVESMHIERITAIQNLITTVAAENGFHSFEVDIQNAAKK
ncbi:hypothetical protein FOH38_19695 [Lysinibacillus fusiformis]|nr:hypothetical protein FOH38_19695 [Lysinibacillus fusiformis]